MFETEKFLFVGGNLYVDFVNTKILRNGRPFELLTSGEDFLGWSMAAGLIGNEAAEDFLNKMTEKDFGAIIGFRNSLNEMTAEIAAGKSLPARSVEAINEQLKRKTGYERIDVSEGRARKEYVAVYTEPLHLLAPLAESAAEILTEANYEYLKKCESDECVLFFYDTSKNHSRRWCSMEACGNRSKANAYYRRKKAETER